VVDSEEFVNVQPIFVVLDRAGWSSRRRDRGGFWQDELELDVDLPVVQGEVGLGGGGCVRVDEHAGEWRAGHPVALAENGVDFLGAHVAEEGAEGMVRRRVEDGGRT